MCIFSASLTMDIPWCAYRIFIYCAPSHRSIHMVLIFISLTLIFPFQASANLLSHLPPHICPTLGLFSLCIKMAECTNQGSAFWGVSSSPQCFGASLRAAVI